MPVNKDQSAISAVHHSELSRAQPEQRKGLDPTGIFSDETYIRGMSSDDPNRAPLMKRYELKDDPKNPGVYGTSGNNYSEND